MNGLPQILDVGDGKTIDRDLAIEATSHILLALKLINGLPSLQDQELVLLDIADMKVSYMLGGDHWLETARQLIDAVLEQEVRL